MSEWLYYRWLGPAREFFKDRGMHATEFDEAQLPGIAAGRQATARGQLRWLDGLMVEAGRPDFICGAEITLADVQVRKSGRLRPFLAVFLRACTSQLASLELT